jgi:hypothetical protein
VNLKIISGGQSGTDQAALRAAKVAGLPTGGFATKGWLTEDGPAPWLSEFGLVETADTSYPSRTRRNVAESDGTLIFDAVCSSGTALAHRECERQRKPFRCILLDKPAKGKPAGLSVSAIPPKEIADWIKEEKIRVLNIGGNRESKCPGIGVLVERFLGVAFGLLARDGK